MYCSTSFLVSNHHNYHNDYNNSTGYIIKLAFQNKMWVMLACKTCRPDARVLWVVSYTIVTVQYILASTLGVLSGCYSRSLLGGSLSLRYKEPTFKSLWVMHIKSLHFIRLEQKNSFLKCHTNDLVQRKLHWNVFIGFRKRICAHCTDTLDTNLKGALCNLLYNKCSIIYVTGV